MDRLFHRYLAQNGMLGRLWAVHSPLPPLRQQLWRRLREALYAPPRRRTGRTAPPGAFRTPWGWRRIATWRRT